MLLENKKHFLFIFLPFIFIAVFIIAIVFHELSHIIAATILGVSLTELKVGLYGLGPGVTLPETFPLEDLIHFRYAGGAGAGILMLIVYITCILRYKASIKIQGWGSVRWWIAGFILFWSLFQFYNGYIESMRFDDYVTDSISYMIPFVLILLVATTIHFLIYYGVIKR